MNPPTKKLRAWRFAGLLTTTWCNARCAFCYVWGSPQQGGTMTPDEAVAYYRQLDAVARVDDRSIKIHLSGGEPFGDFDNLLAILQAIQRAGLGPVQKVETNGFWATDDGIARARLQALREAGLERLDISTDVFHQEFVPIENVRRATRLAREVFGADGVRVRWEGFLDAPVVVAGLPDQQRRDAFLDALAVIHERMTGRAAMELAPRLPEPRPVEAYAGDDCLGKLLKGKHVHVCPDGTVFPGVCSGIRLGHAKTEPLDAMWHRLAATWQTEAILAPLVEAGPVALTELARAFGYEPRPEGYATKCHLCTHVRQFLFERGLFPGQLGPAACYAPRPVFGKDER